MRYALTNNPLGRLEAQAVNDVLKSGRLTIGERVKEFEESFCAYVDKKYAVMTNSGSSANLLAVAALAHKGVFKRGDEAIVPAIAWATTYAPLHQYGLKLRVVDVDETLNVDIEQLKNAMSANTRLLVGVSILGNPAPLPDLRDFAREHGIAFLEDNCESMGGMLAGEPCGSFGDISTFSTFYTHHLNTIEGGIAATDDHELYEIMMCLREHGWDRHITPDGGFYNFVMPGYNVRPTEISAAIGLVQLGRLAKDVRVRRKNAHIFRQLFSDDPRFQLQKENGFSSWFSFTMIADDRNHFIEKMKYAGIEHRMICGGCFTEHPSAKYYDFETVGDLPNAKRAHHHGWFVGNCGHDLTEELRYLKKVL